MITDYVINLKYLNKIEAKIPNANPTNKLQKNSNKNNNINSNDTVNMVSCYPDNNSTDKNKIIDTASLTIPSPNTTLNNLGYFFGLIIVKAATESVAHIVAANTIIYSVFNLIV